MKTQRQAVIVELVNGERISRQELLRQRLLSRGFDVTQATLSRDIKELGLVKRASDGAYQRPDADNGRPRIAETTLRRTIREFLRSCEPVQHLIVLKTDPGERRSSRWTSIAPVSPKWRAPSAATIRFWWSCAMRRRPERSRSASGSGRALARHQGPGIRHQAPRIRHQAPATRDQPAQSGIKGQRSGIREIWPSSLARSP